MMCISHFEEYLIQFRFTQSTESELQKREFTHFSIKTSQNIRKISVTKFNGDSRVLKLANHGAQNALTGCLRLDGSRSPQTLNIVR